jgi:ABC-type lipoprotein release transport system permease subunit
VGLAGSDGVRGILAAYIFEIQPDDAQTHVLVMAIVLTVLVIACLVPASRVFRLSPMDALRHES